VYEFFINPYVFHIHCHVVSPFYLFAEKGYALTPRFGFYCAGRGGICAFFRKMWGAHTKTSAVALKGGKKESK
jgi:hypothetical protein